MVDMTKEEIELIKDLREVKEKGAINYGTIDRAITYIRNTADREPQNCPNCDYRSKVTGSVRGYYVECEDSGCHVTGPFKATKQDAIDAWNKLTQKNGELIKMIKEEIKLLKDLNGMWMGQCKSNQAILENAIKYILKKADKTPQNCPVCGEVSAVAVSSRSTTKYFVRCVNDECDMTGPMGYSEHEAIHLWNQLTIRRIYDDD